MVKILLVAFAVIYAFPGFGNGERMGYSRKVLLVTMDGFRHDYLSKTDTPNFDYLARTGTKARYMTPSFITKTFPTHYTLVTGLYEESHGIVGNAMYDPVLKANFTMRTRDEVWWNGTTPIWIEARTQGLKSMTYFFPGSEVGFAGLRPNYWLNYAKVVPFEQRVKLVTHWFAEDQANLATLYFYEPDSTGHQYGPDSPQVVAAIKRMDGVLGDLINQFNESGILDDVNIIVTSDHGMARMDKANRSIILQDLVDISHIDRVVDWGPVANIKVVPGKVQEVYDALKNHSHMRIFKKEDVPERYHYRRNVRIHDIIAIADEGWYIAETPAGVPNIPGMHGYDNGLMSMKTIFLARGPNIKENHVFDTLNSVDIYPMMCELLEIIPHPNNGSLAATGDFLRKSVVSTSAAVPIQSSFWLSWVFVGLYFAKLAL